MNLQDFPEASRKPPFHFRRGSSSSTDEHQVSAAAAPHHHINPPAPQVKKKSGFQITSVTSAQVSGNNSLADDTESYDDMDESHTEDLSSSEVPDVSAAAVPERSSSDETLNSLHGVETPPPPSPNEPPGLVNGTMVATHHQRHGPDQLAIYKTRKQPEKPGEISILDNANTVTTVTPNTHHQQSQTTTGSRFRVVKLDTNSEPFRKGRWTCTDFYDKEAPPPPLGTDPPPDIESGYDFAPAAQSPPQPPTEPSPSGRPAAIRLPDFIRPTAPFQTQVVPPPLLAPPPQPLPYRPLTALQADLRPLLAPGGGAFPRGGGAAVVRATSQLEDAQKLLLGVPAGDRMAAEANAFMAAAAAVARSHHGDGDDDSSSGASVVAIDNKIEQAMDLVKSHLMFAVREEVEVLKEQIKELLERNNQLEQENDLLKNLASPEQMAQFLAQVQGQGQGQGQGLGLGQGQAQTQGQFQDQLQGQGHSQVQGQVQTQTSSSGSPTVATVTTSASQQLLLPHPNSSGPLA